MNSATTVHEFDRMMRNLTGEAALLPRRPKEIPQTARRFVSEPPRREIGPTVQIELLGGGRVEGILARTTDDGIVVRTDAGDVFVLSSAIRSTVPAKSERVGI